MSQPIVTLVHTVKEQPMAVHLREDHHSHAGDPGCLEGVALIEHHGWLHETRSHLNHTHPEEEFRAGT